MRIFGNSSHVTEQPGTYTQCLLISVTISYRPRTSLHVFRCFNLGVYWRDGGEWCRTFVTRGLQSWRTGLLFFTGGVKSRRFVCFARQSDIATAVQVTRSYTAAWQFQRPETDEWHMSFALRSLKPRERRLRIAWIWGWVDAVGKRTMLVPARNQTQAM
jgi:hypothetical protein